LKSVTANSLKSAFVTPADTLSAEVLWSQSNDKSLFAQFM